MLDGKFRRKFNASPAGESPHGSGERCARRPTMPYHNYDLNPKKVSLGSSFTQCRVYSTRLKAAVHAKPIGQRVRRLATSIECVVLSWDLFCGQYLQRFIQP